MLITIPLDAIDAEALTRDRLHLDPQALAELRRSIARTGLRQPVEVYELPRPGAYGLISGYRRLRAMRDLNPEGGTIPAFLRAPASAAAACAAMVEENEIRADLSPFERGRIAVAATRAGLFDTTETAIDRLYETASKAKRSRLRAFALVAEELDGWLAVPQALTTRQGLRLATALRGGMGKVIRAALESPGADAGPEAQWAALRPYVEEAEADLAAETPRRNGRPRRLLQLRPGLTLRRERTRQGYCLRLTGREATSDFCDEIFDEIERLYAAGPPA